MADQTVLINIEVDEQDAVKGLEKTNKAISKTGDSTEKAAEQTGDYNSALGSLNDQLGGVPAKAAAAVRGVAGLTKGLRTLKGAIIGTGIGALVIALGSLLTWFNRSREGGEQLNKILAGIGAVVDSILDLVGDLGEGIFNAVTDPKQAVEDFGNTIKDFVLGRIEILVNGVGLLGSAFEKFFEGDFSGGLEDLGNGFIDVARTTTPLGLAIDGLVQSGKALGGVISEANADANEAINLAERENQLRRDRDAFLTREAELNRQISAARLETEDLELSAAERLEANAKAQALVSQLANERIAIEREQLSILEGQAALSDSDADTITQIEQLKANIINLETQRDDKLRSIVTRQRSLNVELEKENQLLKEQAQIRAIQEETEIDQAQSKQERLTEIEFEGARARTEIVKEATETGLKLEEDATEERIKFSELETDKKLELVSLYATAALGALRTLFGDNKAFAIADTIVNTATGIMKAFATLPTLVAIPTSVGIAASGAANLNVIKNSKFADGGMVHGKLHSQGGIKAELESGEAVINRRSMANPILREMASQINQIGGGVKFANGGLVGVQQSTQLLNDAIDTLSSQDIRTVLVTEDLNAVQDRVTVTEDLSTL